MPEPWSAEEVDAAVDGYMQMLERELRGERYVKADYIRRIQPRLRDRSKTALERKWQNISAVLIRLRWPFIDGYKPLGNFQQLLCDVVARRAATFPFAALERACTPPPRQVAPSAISMVLAPAPEDDTAQWIAAGWTPGRHVLIDFAELERRHRKLGRAGEKAILGWEQDRLIRAERPDLARQVTWVSKERGDGAGYDIESYDVDGSPLWIEVKTTNRGELMPFVVTRNEVECSEAEPQRYRLYRLFDFSRRPRLYVLPGPLRGTCALREQTFLARPRSNAATHHCGAS